MDWRSLHDVLEFQSVWFIQTPTPSPSPPPLSADVEVLKSQLEFLRQSQSQFIDAMKIIFTVLGIAGALVNYFFGKSFKDFQDSARQDVKEFQKFSRGEVETAIQRVRQEAEAQIPRLVETEVGDIVRYEVSVVKRALQREQVISTTIIDYFLPNGADEPKEVELLRARQFKQVNFCCDVQSLENSQRMRRSPSAVVVLDLQNWKLPSGQAFINLPEVDSETQAKMQIDELLEVIPASAVLVVYIRKQVKYLYNINDRYVIAANNPITLVGNAADGAYVVVGDRTASHSSRS